MLISIRKQKTCFSWFSQFKEMWRRLKVTWKILFNLWLKVTWKILWRCIRRRIWKTKIYVRFSLIMFESSFSLSLIRLFWNLIRFFWAIILEFCSLALSGETPGVFCRRKPKNILHFLLWSSRRQWTWTRCSIVASSTTASSTSIVIVIFVYSIF